MADTGANDQWYGSELGGTFADQLDAADGYNTPDAGASEQAAFPSGDDPYAGGDDSFETGGGWTENAWDSGGTSAMLGDTFSGGGAPAYANLAAGAMELWKGGPSARWGDTLPSLGAQRAPIPMLDTRIPIVDSGGPVDQSIQQYRAILTRASQAIGHRVSAKAIVRFIVKWGWAVASQAFQLDAQSLMALFVRQKARPHRRRGPHLYTVVKRIRAGQRYAKMLSRYAARAHVHGQRAPSRRAPPFRVMRGGKR